LPFGSVPKGLQPVIRNENFDLAARYRVVSLDGQALPSACRLVRHSIYLSVALLGIAYLLLNIQRMTAQFSPPGK
jgi:hypothetical protein